MGNVTLKKRFGLRICANNSQPSVASPNEIGLATGFKARDNPQPVEENYLTRSTPRMACQCPGKVQM